MARHLARRLLFGTLLLSLLLTGGLLSAQAIASAHAAADVVTIQWWNDDWGVFDGPTQHIGDLFTQSHPNIKIQWTFSGNNPVKLKTAIAAGAPPDCAEVSMFGGSLGTFIGTGSLEPLDTFFKQTGLSLREFEPSVAASVQQDGHIWGIPGDAGVYALFYNKDMFRKFGLDPNKPPRTLAELEAMSAKFYRLVNGNVVSLGFDVNSDSFMMYAMRAGGQFYDPVHHKITATDPRNVQTMEWLAQWNKSFDVNKVSRFTASQPGEWQPGNPFVTGHLAFFFDDYWAFYPLDLYGPKVDYGVVPYPTLHGSAAEQRNHPIMGWAVVIPKGSRHPKECLEYMKWAYHDHSDLMAATIVDAPSVLAKFPSFWNMIRRQHPHDRILPYLNIFDQEYRQGRQYFPQIAVSQQYWDALSRATDQVIHGKQQPMQALEAVQTQIQSALDQFMASHHTS